MANIITFIGQISIIIVLVPSVAEGLNCCKCVWVETVGEQCNCAKNPAKKDCLQEPPVRKSGAGDAGSTLAKGQDVCVIGVGHSVDTNKKIFGRIIIENFKLPVPETCSAWHNVNREVPVDGFETVMVERACGCTEEWCNCIGDFSNETGGGGGGGDGTSTPTDVNTSEGEVAELSYRNNVLMFSLILIVKSVQWIVHIMINS